MASTAPSGPPPEHARRKGEFESAWETIPAGAGPVPGRSPRTEQAVVTLYGRAPRKRHHAPWITVNLHTGRTVPSVEAWKQPPALNEPSRHLDRIIADDLEQVPLTLAPGAGPPIRSAEGVTQCVVGVQPSADGVVGGDGVARVLVSAGSADELTELLSSVLQGLAHPITGGVELELGGPNTGGVLAGLNSAWSIRRRCSTKAIAHYVFQFEVNLYPYKSRGGRQRQNFSPPLVQQRPVRPAY